MIIFQKPYFQFWMAKCRGKKLILLPHFLALWPWESYLTSLNLHLPIFKTGLLQKLDDACKIHSAQHI